MLSKNLISVHSFSYIQEKNTMSSNLNVDALSATEVAELHTKLSDKMKALSLSKKIELGDTYKIYTSCLNNGHARIVEGKVIYVKTELIIMPLPQYASIQVKSTEECKTRPIIGVKIIEENGHITSSAY